jgi:hypothetical protein
VYARAIATTIGSVLVIYYVGKEQQRVTRFWDAKRPEWLHRHRMLSMTDMDALVGMNWVPQLKQQ